MKFEILAYIATFIISAGLAVIGISVSYQLYQVNKKAIFQILLYQQIFLFSFFIYGIWGNMVIRELIADFNISVELASKLALFIPMIGLPFLVVSWFMLVRMGFDFNGRKLTKQFTYVFFPLLILLPFLVTLLIHLEVMATPENPDLFVIQILLALNLGIHFLFYFPFIVRRREQQKKPIVKLENKYIFFHFIGVVLYSVLLNFYYQFDYISTCIAVITLFGVSIFLPVFLKIKGNGNPIQEELVSIDFEAFCELYEISRREAEIVLENLYRQDQ